MSDDALTRAKQSLSDNIYCIQHGVSAPYPRRMIEDLLALAESQAQQLAEIRKIAERGGIDPVMANHILAILDRNQP